MPDRQGQFRSRLEDSQHLANGVAGGREEHGAEAADHGIESVRGERKVVCEGDLKLDVANGEMVCGAACARDHFGNGIDAEDLAFGSDQGSQGQGGFSGTGGNIQDGVTGGNQRILDKSLGDRGKHLADHFAVLFPERRGTAPFLNHRLFGLHLSKYIEEWRRRCHSHSEKLVEGTAGRRRAGSGRPARTRHRR